MADNSAEIAALEEILNSGTKSVAVDGLSTSYDLVAIRKRLVELRQTDDASVGKRRPSIVTVKFS